MVKALETFSVIISDRIAPGDDFIFMVRFHRNGHFRIFTIGGCQFSIKGSLCKGVKFVEGLVFKVLAAIIE